jgi:PASTA domain
VCHDGAGNTVTLSGTCDVVEYGDDDDIMGGGAAGFNAMERQKLGWLSGRLTDVPSGGGTYTLTPLELTTPGLQALRINDGTTLWVEFRQRIGMAVHGLNSPGVIVHQQADGVLKSYQLNMNPSGPNYNRSLAVGASWVNPFGGLKITVNWANSTGASVTIAPAIPPVAVPYLIDDTCGQALAELEAVGLAGNCWGTGDYVGNQSPGGGSLVPPGTVVSLQMAVNPP